MTLGGHHLSAATFVTLKIMKENIVMDLQVLDIVEGQATELSCAQSLLQALMGSDLPVVGLEEVLQVLQ